MKRIAVLLIFLPLVFGCMNCSKTAQDTKADDNKAQTAQSPAAIAGEQKGNTVAIPNSGTPEQPAKTQPQEKINPNDKAFNKPKMIKSYELGYAYFATEEFKQKYIELATKIEPMVMGLIKKKVEEKKIWEEIMLKFKIGRAHV